MITLTLTSAGMQLARPGATITVAPQDGAGLARAIAQLAHRPTAPPPAPAQAGAALGQRLAAARRRYL
jgi:hypothetical protein